MSPAPLSIEPSSANTEALASSRDRVAGRTVLQSEPHAGGADVWSVVFAGLQDDDVVVGDVVDQTVRFVDAA